jgi:hypothetical protein
MSYSPKTGVDPLTTEDISVSTLLNNTTLIIITSMHGMDVNRIIFPIVRRLVQVGITIVMVHHGDVGVVLSILVVLQQLIMH